MNHSDVISYPVVARPTLVSLFSGAGGLDIGLERAGWQTVVATDKDPDAVATLRANQETAIPIEGHTTRTYLQDARILERDVHGLSAADLRPAGVKRDWRPSLLAGGPPCQPWSSAGLQRGFFDPRGLLISQMVRLTDELRPRYVLMENVRGLLTAVGPGGHHGEAIELLQKEWENLGYAVRWGLLNAADYGAPQRRVRLVMIASADHRLVALPMPTHSKDGGSFLLPWVTLQAFLDELPAPAPDEIVRPAGKRSAELLQLTPGSGLRAGGTIEHQRPGGHWGYRQDCFVADPSLPSRTIRAAATPDWLHLPDGMRRLTYRECAGLQGFPPDWRFPAKKDVCFRLIGNAVQTNMAEALGLALLNGLKPGKLAEPPASAEWPPYFTRRIRGARADHRANEASRKRHLERVT